MSSETTSTTTEPGKRKLFKVAFDLPDEIAEWAHASAERLWAAKTPTKMELQVRNVPFYVKGVAFDDIVRVRADNDRREFVFEHLVSESGHSTVRIIIKDESARDETEELLRELNCTWEIDSSGLLWAVDITPDIAYAPVRAALVRARDEGKIGVQEGSMAQAHAREKW